jgi:orotate phosphoribosyltransferase
MEDKSFNISLTKNPKISIKATPGHFSASNTHSNHYLDVSRLKSNAQIAQDVARELAVPYLTSTIVDAVVCMDRTTVVGAFLAEELFMHGTTVINAGCEIHVMAPTSSVNGKLIFQDSMLDRIHSKNVILLVASVSSGRTVNIALECLEYYGAQLVGISALFLASFYNPQQKKINALFTSEDLPEFKVFSPDKCEMCKSGQELDAIATSEGYTMIPKSA